MITINLKPGVKRSKGGPSFSGGLSALKELPGKLAGAKNPWPIAAIAVWVVVLGYLGWVGISSATTLSQMETKLTTARQENSRFRALIRAKQRVQAARDSVITQIATIRTVDGDRYVWPHILDEITRAVPPYTWLVDVSSITQVAIDSSAAVPQNVAVQLHGRTMDIQGFTRFMRQLEESPWLSDVTLISTTTEIDHSRAVTVFTVKANYVRHVPGATPAGED